MGKCVTLRPARMCEAFTSSRGRVRPLRRGEQRTKAMRLTEFVLNLKLQDAAIGVGLVELIRRADYRGSIERGDWLAAGRSAFARAEAGAQEGAMGDPDAPEELGRSLEEHVLERRGSEGLARTEPPGEGWERARVEPD